MKLDTRSAVAILMGVIIAIADIIWTYQSYYDTVWLALGIVIFVADIAWLYIDFGFMKK